jgi:hypothetical protein
MGKAGSGRRGHWRGLMAMAGLLLVVMLPGSARASSPLLWSAPELVDHEPPYETLTLASFKDISCPTTSLCVAVDSNGDVITSTNPTGGAGAWTVTNIRSVSFPNGYKAISCPSIHLCVALDGDENISVSTNPTGGASAWSVFAAPTPEEFIPYGTTGGDVSCPSVSMCVITDGNGDVLTSTNPTGGASAWSFSEGIGGSLACPSTSLCVAVGSSIFTTTNPTGGASAWQDGGGLSGVSLGGLSCPTTSLCIAGASTSSSSTSGIAWSTNPTGGSGAWSETTLGKWINALSCPSASLCIAAAGHEILTSTNPTGGAGTWTSATVDTQAYLRAISCASASLCAAVDSTGSDSGGNVAASANPTSGSGAWTTTKVLSKGTSRLTGIACPSSSLCVATDTTGHILTSTNPIAGAAAWGSTYLVSPYPVARDVSCPSISLCVAVSGPEILTSTNPTGGASSWQAITVGPTEGQIGSMVTCPSTALCVVTDVQGDVITSTNPTGGAGAWQVAKVDSSGLGHPACASTSLCIASGSGGRLFTSTNPTGGSGAWSAVTLGLSGNLGDPACPSAVLCMVPDSSFGAPGKVLISTNPTGGAGAWQSTTLDGVEPLTLACPSTQLCVAGGYGGVVATSTNPTGGSAAWNVSSVDNATLDSNAISALGCASTALCLAGDMAGYVVVGTPTPPEESSAGPPQGSAPSNTGTPSPPPGKRPTPTNKPLKCHKGFRKKTVHGKARCVKVKHSARKRHGHKAKRLLEASTLQNCKQAALEMPTLVEANMHAPGKRNQLTFIKFSYESVAKECGQRWRRHSDFRTQLENPKHRKHWINMDRTWLFMLLPGNYAEVPAHDLHSNGHQGPQVYDRCIKTPNGMRRQKARVVIRNRVVDAKNDHIEGQSFGSWPIEVVGGC